MDDPTKKTLEIFSGEAEVAPKGKPHSPQSVVVQAMEATTQFIPLAKPHTLEELMAREQFSPEQKERCSKRCETYLQTEENLTSYLSLMGDLSRKENNLIPSFALYLPAVFSLPPPEQESLLAVIRKNLDKEEIFSAYRCVLEANQEILRARIYSGLDQLRLNHNDRNNQSIWTDLNNAFAHHVFLQRKNAEESDEFSEQEQRLEFLDLVVPHYLEMAGQVSAAFSEKKPVEARIVARRVALEYGRFREGESNIEGMLKNVKDYVAGGIDFSLKEWLKYFILEETGKPSAVRAELPAEGKPQERTIPTNTEAASRVHRREAIVEGFLGLVLVGLIVYNATSVPTLRSKVDALQKTVGRATLERNDYQELAESYETRIAEGEFVLAEEAYACEMPEGSAPQAEAVEVPGSVLGYLTPEEAGGQLLDAEVYVSELTEANETLGNDNHQLWKENASLSQALASSRLQSQMSDESNQQLQEEKEDLAVKAALYERGDLCLQFRTLVKKRDTKSINRFVIDFASNYFNGCRTMSLEEFADKVCYSYVHDKSYATMRQEVTQDLAAAFEFDPKRPVRLCPKN